MVDKSERKIIVTRDGPYTVKGSIPLVSKQQVVSEFGEPLIWRKTGSFAERETYDLCRCGQTKDAPFCDCSHFDFDGTETADTRPTTERQVTLPGTGIEVREDEYLCSESGFCANRLTSIRRMMPQTGDPQVRATVMEMIANCPAGAYVFSLQPGGEDIEPDLPVEIAATVEITSAGPVRGPLWVTGGIPVERADGQPFETRNRVALCACGRSSKMPLCDGTHRNPRR